MILTVVSSILIMTLRRRVMIEVFPHTLRDFWKEWELRALVFLSLISQIFLIIFGNRRKYNPRFWVKCVNWTFYLLADSVATMALGVLLNNLGDIYEDEGCLVDNNDQLVAFWAPFLLLHLGGPDTITAYSFEDNELFLRHAFQLAVQSLTTLYIFLMAWSGARFSILSIPMILVGIIKYGERIWNLWLASREELRDSMLTPPDPGPNYPKFTDEYSLKEAEGYLVEAEEVKDTQAMDMTPLGAESIHDADNISKAHYLLQTFRCLFADLILSYQDREYSQSLFQKMSQKDAFTVIAIELGFMYDTLYTKTTVICTRWGLARRGFTACLIVLVLVLFIVMDKKKYVDVDLLITFLLLVVAVLLEIYAVFILLLSDQARVWIVMHEKTRWGNRVLKILNFLGPFVKQQRWSNSMRQYSFTKLCLKEKPCHPILSFLHRKELWEKHKYRSFKKVPQHLETLIFKHVMKKYKSEKPSKGSRVLEKHNLSSLISLSIDVDFDQSILIWYIATELCYYSATWDNNSYNINRKMSKAISQYMMSLLILYPFLLPVGIGLIRFRDTREEVWKFFKERKSTFSTSQMQNSTKANQRREKRIKACNMLLKVKTDVPPIKVKGDRSKSVLFDACKLASSLNEIADPKQKWKVIKGVWLQILTYAASQGRGSQHAQQLKRGGELLTHVWLLISHMGMTDQFQIAQGHARAKLEVN